MSRRRGEFEHRTSIFEGAFRAWSHLGGLTPTDLETKQASELDPLAFPLETDVRLKNAKPNETKDVFNADGTKRHIYAYEPLPRSGLAHPYVQAILSPWLGPDADHDAIQLGLTTLRTWWQHRRKGESGSAVAALGTDKMRGVVEGYTRHFFNLAHCLIVNDKEQPPRSLYSKMKDVDKARNKKNKKRAREEEASKLIEMAKNNAVGGVLDPSQGAGGGGDNLSPLERLHAEQRRQLANVGGVHSADGSLLSDGQTTPQINMKGKCVPGKLDLPGLVDQVNHQATQLAHRGTASTAGPIPVLSGSGVVGGIDTSVPKETYGDPNTTPVVFVSDNGDIQIAMTIDGITCAHCVKIVETVLKGCNGNKSPIDGLLDAAADRVLCSVLIKIDHAGNAKRIAFEAARNLAMVGYTAKAKEMSIVNVGGDKKATMDLGALSTAFDVVATTDPKDVFQWNVPCTCPDSGVLREDCARHSQMNTSIFQAFEMREQQVTEYMAGCGLKYGGPCTCGPDCRCKNCSGECKENKQKVRFPVAQQQLQQHQQPHHHQQQQHQHDVGGISNQYYASANHHPGGTAGGGGGGGDDLDPLPHDDSEPLPAHGGMPPPQNLVYNAVNGQPNPNPEDQYQPQPLPASRMSVRMSGVGENGPMAYRMSDLRNSSILSFGTGGNSQNYRNSLASEKTWDRAMSGLSALSIDWENMEGFDVNVDHSAHINAAQGGGGAAGGGGGGGVAAAAAVVRRQDELENAANAAIRM